MQTIQVVIDEELLERTDAAARQGALNRSALVRVALRDYLRRRALLAKEELDRAGYELQPDTEAALQGWESVATWPED